MKTAAKSAALCLAAALLLAATISSPGLMAAETAQAVDEREAIVLDERGRTAILEEMRKHLSNVQTILEAFAKEDMQAVAKAARASGMEAAREADPHMQSELPQDFKKLGFGMHRDFDAMATDTEKFHDPKKALFELSGILNQCVGCHATYQVRTAPRAP